MLLASAAEVAEVAYEKEGALRLKEASNFRDRCLERPSEALFELCMDEYAVLMLSVLDGTSSVMALVFFYR